MNTPPCDIEHITSELKNALEREATNIFDIGTLLIKAQDQLPHGKWLEWLEVNFGKSVRTAQNYMNAAKLAIKYATVAHLKLKPTALYYLGNNMENIPLDELEAIFKAAEITWLDDDDVGAIIRSIHEERDRTPSDPEKLKQEHEEATRKRAEEEAETDAILAGPSPDVTPPQETAPIDVNLVSFDKAVDTLLKLHTKPIATFAATQHKSDELRKINNFLDYIAARDMRETGAITTREEQIEAAIQALVEAAGGLHYNDRLDVMINVCKALHVAPSMVMEREFEQARRAGLIEHLSFKKDK